MLVLGADLITFYKEWEGWAQDTYADFLPINMREDGIIVWTANLPDNWDLSCAPAVDPAGTYDVTWGRLSYGGEKASRPADFNEDFTAVLQKWIQSRTVTTFAVTVSNADVEVFRRICAEHGWVL